MLVLGRRSGESIMVGDDIVVTVLDIRGDAVRIGIDAPRTVRVHREEVFKAVQAANQAAVIQHHSHTQLLQSLLKQSQRKQQGESS